jgi:hypothetical protein
MTISNPDDDQEEDRLKFLATCGRFAAVTPPTITILLLTSLTSNEIAETIGSYDNHSGKGNNNNN